MNDPQSGSAPARYHGAAIVLHWLVAALLVYQFMLGLRLEDKAAPSEVFTAFQQHKSVGIAILLLSLARLALRLALPRPAEIGTGLERLAAKLAHVAFYAVMLLGPLTGWAVASTAKIKVPTVLFGVIALPHLPLPASFNEVGELAHSALGWALPALLALHVAAVVYHMRARDEVPQRMVPTGLATHAGLGAGLAALALAAWLGAAGPLPHLWSKLTAPAPAPAPLASIDASEEALPSAEPSESEEATALASDVALASEAAKSCDWAVAAGSRLGFTASYSGEAVGGSFSDWTAKIVFCEDDPAAASISASIGLASANTADATRDENLKGSSFFDVASFPRAKFAAHGFKPLGGGRYSADGTLTLHGKSRPVRLTFTIRVTGDKANAQGSARLSRLAFGVGSDEWAATDQIADAVTVNFTIVARRK